MTTYGDAPCSVNGPLTLLNSVLLSHEGAINKPRYASTAQVTSAGDKFQRRPPVTGNELDNASSDVVTRALDASRVWEICQ